MDLTGLPSELVATAQAAETAGVDYLVLPDRTAARPDGASPPTALIAAAFLAARTDEIGIVVTAATAYHEPYSLARQVASLDHIGAGRVGWFADSTTDAASDANHRREGHDPARNAAARAQEFVPLVRDLWDSWEDGAFVHEKDTGRFVDPARIHAVDHVGAVLAVRGPLNVIRPPQGQPVVFARAADTPVADHADVLVSGVPQADHAFAVVPFVARDEAVARELHAAAGSPAGDADNAVIVGTPEQVAAQLRHPHVLVRFTTRGQLAAFTELVLPLLDRSAPSGPTLRARFGLPAAPNRFAPTQDKELTGNAR
ncbi:LLM class flavin-dependent oxidoreductase [Lentzea nigeriaca]|uniref:LLM class flavin-dependent oxidoreductase n=1 Tax=Lentzea nigeriaca TaxID=1128665 RepID=UPI001956A04D|nr:LLM class flavin-dependent oxidoreductase [Lentzea nigeriaca]MBM7856442.1 alkanesulfonate monooxygenase SsuD/methylene tetrahydromethanopterin reductase-like flavin-dependent oxidoreductase (luciferase family) [Lentzea nigeriaca]